MDDSAGREFLFFDATVITMDPERPIASGILVRGGRIAQVGSAEAVRAAAGKKAIPRSLGGATVIPGLIDAHCHFSIVGYLSRSVDCSQPGSPDIVGIKRRLSEAAHRTPSEAWVTGYGYVEYKLREDRHPTRWDLDEAVPDRPCVLYHTSLHACVVNSRALKEAGYHDDSPEPVDGQLGRASDGRLNGVLHEAPMFKLLAANMARDIEGMGETDRVEMVERAGRHFAALGITCCVDADLRRESYEALSSADARGTLEVRVAAMLDHHELDWIRETGRCPGGSDHFRVNGVKIFADGGMSSRMAAIEGRYAVAPHGSGMLLHDLDELTRLVRDCDELGFQVGVHAQGDRAIRMVLDAYDSVLAAHPGNPRRHRIEHGGAMSPQLIARTAALRLPVVSQPGFLSALGDGFHEAFGPEQSQGLYPFRSMRSAGVVVAGSSDAPVIGASPFVGIRDAMLRQTESGRVLGYEERLTAKEGLELYTQAASYAALWEQDIGSLESGKRADLVVLDGNPLEVDPQRLPDIQVLATIVGGKVAHRSSSFATLGPD